MKNGTVNTFFNIWEIRVIISRMKPANVCVYLVPVAYAEISYGRLASYEKCQKHMSLMGPVEKNDKVRTSLPNPRRRMQPSKLFQVACEIIIL